MDGVARGPSSVSGTKSSSHPSGRKQILCGGVGSGAAETVLVSGVPTQPLGITQASIGPLAGVGCGDAATAVSRVVKGMAAAVAASTADAAVLIFIF
jgi:hypothetical protein